MKKTAYILVLAALAGLVAAPGNVSAAPDYNAWQSQDLIKVTPVLEGNTWTWTVFNTTGAPDGNGNPGASVLSWSLIPYNVNAPVAVSGWTAPDGWVWRNGGFEIDKSSQKYYTLPALGPQQTFVFTYTFDPNAAVVNSAPKVEGPTFLSHVAAVVPGSGTLNDPYVKQGKWQESKWMLDSGKKESTWFDWDPLPPDIPDAPVPVPEPATMILSGLGLAAVIRRKLAS